MNPPSRMPPATSRLVPTSNAFTEIKRELPESWKIGFKLISDGSSTLRREFGV